MKTMRKTLALLLTMTLALALFAGCAATPTDSGSAPSASSEESAGEETTGEDTLLSGKHHIQIDVKDYGIISVELDADVAPVTVTNFIDLAKSGFYDGLTFHRIISGFMIQGGDPLGNGTGGASNTIVGEFSDNGYENSLSHTRGVISMARSSGDYDSASSQFFIVHEDSAFLDGQYAAFGYVTEGMDIVDKICEDTPVQDNNGTVNAEDQPVISSIVVLD